MIFITGGKCQGKTTFAKTLGKDILDDLDILIKNWFLEKADINKKIEEILANENLVIVCAEIGCGIIPIEKQEREIREITGRTACKIAQKAKEVYLLQSGIPMKIK